MGIISGLKLAAGLGILLAVVWFWNHYAGLKETIAEKSDIIKDYKGQLAQAGVENADLNTEINALGRANASAVARLAVVSARDLDRQKDVSNAHVEIEKIAHAAPECAVGDSVLFALDRLRRRPGPMRPGDVGPDGDTDPATIADDP